jgi:hypothetical protein
MGEGKQERDWKKKVEIRWGHCYFKSRWKRTWMIRQNESLKIKDPPILKIENFLHLSLQNSKISKKLIEAKFRLFLEIRGRIHNTYVSS